MIRSKTKVPFQDTRRKFENKLLKLSRSQEGTENLKQRNQKRQNNHVRAEINEIDCRCTVEKLNRSKNNFSEMNKETDEPDPYKTNQSNTKNTD